MKVTSVVIQPGPMPETKEEQAVWDQLALRSLDRGAPAADCYALTKGAALDLIRARRAALASRDADRVGQAEPHQEPSRGDWFLSVRGNKLYPLDVRPEDVKIDEIAHALAHLCRFNGHCREFYSVAQHSVLVARIVPPELRLVGLLHDATEAYCGDMIRPLKLALPAYKAVEEKIWLAIAERYGLPAVLPPEVKAADNRALMTERRDLLVSGGHDWSIKEEPVDAVIHPLSPAQAYAVFLDEFARLYGGEAAS